MPTMNDWKLKRYGIKQVPKKQCVILQFNRDYKRSKSETSSRV